MGAFKDLAIVEQNAARIAARKGSGLYRYRFAGGYSPALCPDCISDVLAANPNMQLADWEPASWIGWQMEAYCDSCDTVPNGDNKDRARR